MSLRNSWDICVRFGFHWLKAELFNGKRSIGGDYMNRLDDYEVVRKYEMVEVLINRSLQFKFYMTNCVRVSFFIVYLGIVARET
jgi:hypothetical protein